MNALLKGCPPAYVSTSTTSVSVSEFAFYSDPGPARNIHVPQGGRASMLAGRIHDLMSTFILRSTFSRGHERYELTHPVVFQLEAEDDLWIASCEELGLEAVAPSRDAVQAAIDATFEALYGALVEQTDVPLSAEAEVLRARLVGMIRKAGHAA